MEPIFRLLSFRHYRPPSSLKEALPLPSAWYPSRAPSPLVPWPGWGGGSPVGGVRLALPGRQGWEGCPGEGWRVRKAGKESREDGGNVAQKTTNIFVYFCNVNYCTKKKYFDIIKMSKDIVT